MTTATATKPDVFDLGGTYVEKGQRVYVAASGRDKAFEGTVTSVDYRDGTAHTVGVWDGGKHRDVVAARVSTEPHAQPTTTKPTKRASSGKATARPSKILPRPEENKVSTTKSTTSTKRAPARKAPATKKAPAKRTPAKATTSNVVPLRPFPFAGIEWSITHGGVVTREGVQTGDHAWVNARTYMKNHLTDVVKMAPSKIDALLTEMAEAVRAGKGGTFGPVKVRVRKA